MLFQVKSVTILVDSRFRVPGKPLDPSTGLPGNICCHFFNYLNLEQGFFKSDEKSQWRLPDIPGFPRDEHNVLNGEEHCIMMSGYAISNEQSEH